MSTTLNNPAVWQTKLLWTGVALLGAVAFAIVALNRGERSMPPGWSPPRFAFIS